MAQPISLVDQCLTPDGPRPCLCAPTEVIGVLRCTLKDTYKLCKKPSASWIKTIPDLKADCSNFECVYKEQRFPCNCTQLHLHGYSLSQCDSVDFHKHYICRIGSPSVCFSTANVTASHISCYRDDQNRTRCYHPLEECTDLGDYWRCGKAGRYPTRVSFVARVETCSPGSNGFMQADQWEALHVDDRVEIMKTKPCFDRIPDDIWNRGDVTCDTRTECDRLSGLLCNTTVNLTSSIDYAFPRDCSVKIAGAKCFWDCSPPPILEKPPTTGEWHISKLDAEKMSPTTWKKIRERGLKMVIHTLDSNHTLPYCTTNELSTNCEVSTVNCTIESECEAELLLLCQEKVLVNVIGYVRIPKDCNATIYQLPTTVSRSARKCKDSLVSLYRDNYAFQAKKGLGMYDCKGYAIGPSTIRTATHCFEHTRRLIAYQKGFYAYCDLRDSSVASDVATCVLNRFEQFGASIRSYVAGENILSLDYTSEESRIDKDDVVSTYSGSEWKEAKIIAMNDREVVVRAQSKPGLSGMPVCQRDRAIATVTGNIGTNKMYLYASRNNGTLFVYDEEVPVETESWWSMFKFGRTSAAEPPCTPSHGEWGDFCHRCLSLDEHPQHCECSVHTLLTRIIDDVTEMAEGIDALANLQNVADHIDAIENAENENADPDLPIGGDEDLDAQVQEAQHEAFAAIAAEAEDVEEGIQALRDAHIASQVPLPLMEGNLTGNEIAAMLAHSGMVRWIYQRTSWESLTYDSLSIRVRDQLVCQAYGSMLPSVSIKPWAQLTRTQRAIIGSEMRSKPHFIALSSAERWRKFGRMELSPQVPDELVDVHHTQRAGLGFEQDFHNGLTTRK